MNPCEDCNRNCEIPCWKVEHGLLMDIDTVALMFYDAFGDYCACNYNGNDEWLWEYCELIEECPNPSDKLGCWKQYIKHNDKRRIKE